MVGKIPSHRPQSSENQPPLNNDIHKLRNAKRTLQGRKVAQLSSHLILGKVPTVGKSSNTHKNHKAKQLPESKFIKTQNVALRFIFPHLS